MPRILNLKTRAGTTAEWLAAKAAGRKLDAKELGYDSTTKQLYVGDGTTDIDALGAVGSGTYATVPTPGTPGTAVVLAGAQTITGAKTFDVSPIFKTGPVFDVRAYGATGDGVTDDQAAINAAVTAASAAGGGTVYLPHGTYSIGTFISLKDGANIRGDGETMTLVKARSGLATGLFVGTGANTVTDVSIEALTLDGQFSILGTSLKGIQVSSGARIEVRQVTTQDTGSSGVLLQTGTVDSLVEGCRILTSGLDGAGTSHGIYVTGASHRAKIRGNWVIGGKGMGISVAALGSGSTDCEISGNYVSVVASTTGFECIGVTADCLRTIIANNHCVNSQDNGISCTPAESVVIGNTVETTLNHGIYLKGNNSVCVGNRIRNPGLAFLTDGLVYNGVYLDGANDCTVVGNRIYDDQGTKTMTNAIKENTGANNNVLIGNRCSGFITAEFSRIGAGTIALLGTRPTITGAKGGNAALGSLLTALSTAGLVNDTTTA